ncbi:hypothetical protein [Enterocloster clostridioformis]|uniref:hypothetical protein n=1 Tax=Enterocloster clostridioformis TaxID=1531 RepID=UPI00325ABD50
MAIPKGKNEYKINSTKIVAFGISHSKEEMELSLCTDVYNKLYDVKENIDLVNSLQDTGFDKMLIMQKIFPNDMKESWEIGEAYAQAYAESNLSAIIPWGITRDIKKPGSSLPGADIIGLYRHDSGTYFLFGEIKTSSDKNCPPGVMYGEHGLKNQLEDLCQKKELTSQLVKYLAHRLKGGTLWPQYTEAFIKYMYSDQKAVHILGILVRDIMPSKEDLNTRAKALEKFAVGDRTIELVGIYVPKDELKKFPQFIQEERGRRSISNVRKE